MEVSLTCSWEVCCLPTSSAMKLCVGENKWKCCCYSGVFPPPLAPPVGLNSTNDIVIRSETEIWRNPACLRLYSSVTVESHVYRVFSLSHRLNSTKDESSNVFFIVITALPLLWGVFSWSGVSNVQSMTGCLVSVAPHIWAVFRKWEQWAKQYSRPACSHHTPRPRSLCSQVKHSCEGSLNRLCERLLRLH